MTRDISFDEEVAECGPEAQESFADVRPLGEVEAMRARWAMQMDAAPQRRPGERLVHVSTPSSDAVVAVSVRGCVVNQRVLVERLRR